MTSKTFKSADFDNRELEVDVLFGNPRLLIKDFDGDNKGFIFGKADAPAIALAILEAAGWPNEHLVTTEILRRLCEFDKHLKAIETEAKERAELEAEALDFLNVSREAKHLGPLGNFDEHTKDAWLAVARRARELRAEK